jgi:hypothetical protein
VRTFSDPRWCVDPLRSIADATLSTMAVKEPDRSHDGGWEAALEAVEQLTVAVSRVGDAGALESA